MNKQNMPNRVAENMFGFLWGVFQRLGKMERLMFWIWLIVLWGILLPDLELLKLIGGKGLSVLCSLASLCFLVILGRGIWRKLQEEKYSTLKHIVIIVSGFWTIINIGVLIEFAVILVVSSLSSFDLQALPKSVQAKSQISLVIYNDFIIHFLGCCWLSFKIRERRLVWFCGLLLVLPMGLSDHADMSIISTIWHFLLSLGAILSGGYLGCKYLSVATSEDGFAVSVGRRTLLVASGILGLFIFLSSVAEKYSTDWKVSLLIEKVDRNEGPGWGFSRQQAAQSLGELGVKAKAAVPALVRALKDNSLFGKVAVAEALGNIGPEAKDAVPELINLIRIYESMWRAEPNPPAVVLAAVYALGKIGPDAKTARLILLQLAESDNKQLRNAALKALKDIGFQAEAQADTE